MPTMALFYKADPLRCNVSGEAAVLAHSDKANLLLLWQSHVQESTWLKASSAVPNVVLDLKMQE